MTFSKPSASGFAFEGVIPSQAMNYINNSFPNIMDKTGDTFGGAIHVGAGGSITFDVGAGALVFNGGDIAFNNATGINFNGTSGITFSGSSNTFIINSTGSLLNAGTLNITSGGTLGINSGASMHVKNGATETVDSGGTLALASGAIGTVAGGASVSYASGANLNLNAGSFLNLTTTTIVSTGASLWSLTGDTMDFANGGGGFLTVGTGNTLTVAGTQKNTGFPKFITPQTRQSCMGIDKGSVQNGNWLRQSSGVQNTDSGPFSPGQSTLIIPLDRLHNGCTLASVFIAFIVGTPHSGVPANLPVFSVYRYGQLGGSGPVTYQYLNSVATQSPTNPGSGALWYASGGVQYFQYITNQNNIIDNTNYNYAFSVSDESGTNSLGGNFYLQIFAENQVIQDLSWNI